MIASPVGDAREGRQRLADVVRFGIASTATAAALGFLLGSAGHVVLPPHAWHTRLVTMLVTVVALVFAATEAMGIKLLVPTRDWIVPRKWGLIYGRRRFYYLFGAMMGAGLLTMVPFIGVYLVIASCLLLGSGGAAATVMALFGLGRTVPLLAVALSLRSSGSALRQLPSGLGSAVARFGCRDLRWYRALSLGALAYALWT